MSPTNSASCNGQLLTIDATTSHAQLTLPEKTATLSSTNDSGWHGQVTRSQVVSADNCISFITPEPILRASGSIFCDHNSLAQKRSSGPNAKSLRLMVMAELISLEPHQDISRKPGQSSHLEHSRPHSPRFCSYWTEALPLFQGLPLERPSPQAHPTPVFPLLPSRKGRGSGRTS